MNKMSRQVSLTSCLAKMYESNLDTAGGTGISMSKSRFTGGNNLSSLDKKLNLLNEKVDRLLNFQEDVMGKLETVHQGIDELEKGIDKLMVPSVPSDLPKGTEGALNSTEDIPYGNLDGMCAEILRLMKTVHHDTLKQGEKLVGVEKMVSAVDKAIIFLGDTFKNSKVVDFILKGIVPWKKGSLSEVPDEVKEKPEVKDARPKHVLSSRGVQVEVRRTGNDPRKGTKLDGNSGKCEQVKWQTTDISKADSSLTVEEQKPDPQMVKPEKTNSPKNDVNVRTSKKDSVLPISLNANRSQDLGTNGEVKPHRSGPEETPNQVAHGKPMEMKNSDPTLSTASSETIPSMSQSLSKVDSQPLLPRFSSTVQKADTREAILMTHERSQNSMVCESTKEKAPFRLPAQAEEDRHLQEKLKYKQCHKDIRTEPRREGRDVKSEGKLDPQAISAGKPQMLFCKSSVDKTVVERAEHKCKGLTPPSSVEKDSKREAAGMRQSFQEPPEATKILDNDSDSLNPQSEIPLTGGMESETKKATGTSTTSGTDTVVIDDSPPPPAPFAHRIVSVQPAPATTCYAVCQHEVLGGGRFGQVHKCTELSSGLSLAAKIIKVKGAKDREEVKNEINIMNQLNHVNLIQLFDAFECKNDITLIVEYVDGGELFDRITDENYNLTELDAILFTKQICEGVYYLHQQYILHLDLKPENILCVNRTGNQIKIIDFGLARRYKPREKLKVNFGTPEFLAPEVVNYDFVSFPTDMWSVGVITYMLLSGLSPFLGESDTETMNFIVNCSWDFDADAFEQVSEEAKDFILQLLVKEKCGRISAAQCLKHKWLNDLPAKAKKFRMRLKSQVLLQSYLAQRKWKVSLCKHFYAVTAAYRLRKFQHMGSVNSA